VIKIYNKVKVFANELSFIKNKKIRGFAEKAISELPDYFFEVAASSTGKYHTQYALGAGGLVRHTKGAAIIANDLLELEMYGSYTSDEKDLMIVSVILHDGKKHGEEKSEYTVAEHPLVVAEWIKNNKNLNSLLPVEQINFIYDGIISHMGQWNTDSKTKKVILPKPTTKYQKFIHQCDYLASRKYLNFDFGDNYYDPKDFLDDGLSELIQNINAMCKKYIKNGVNKSDLYQIIADNNEGNKNPNSIGNAEEAQKIIKILEDTFNG